MSSSGKGVTGVGSSLKVLAERKAAGAMTRKRKRVEVPSSPSRPALDRSVVLGESLNPASWLGFASDCCHAILTFSESLFVLGSLVVAYFHGWTKERRQVDVCNTIGTQFLLQQNGILLFIRQWLGGNAIRSIPLNLART